MRTHFFGADTCPRLSGTIAMSTSVTERPPLPFRDWTLWAVCFAALLSCATVWPIGTFWDACLGLRARWEDVPISQIVCDWVYTVCCMPYMDLDDLDGTWSSLAHWSGMLCVMVLVLGRYVNVAGNHWYVLVRYGLFWHDMTWCATVCDLNVFVCEYATACDVTWLDMYPVSNFCYMTCDMWDYVSKSKRSVKVKVRLVKVSMSQSTM